MEHDETGFQAPPEGPVLCINNCGFFGSAATMNLCSKCHKDKLLKKEQAKLAASSIDSIVNGKSSASLKIGKAGEVEVITTTVEAKTITTQTTTDASTSESQAPETKGPIRCHMCKKRVGLTGFKCRCGNDFCAMHRYTDKHDCSFDYRTAGRDAIAKANPVVKAEKLDKI